MEAKRNLHVEGQQALFGWGLRWRERGGLEWWQGEGWSKMSQSLSFGLGDYLVGDVGGSPAYFAHPPGVGMVESELGRLSLGHWPPATAANTQGLMSAHSGNLVFGTTGPLTWQPH